MRQYMQSQGFEDKFEKQIFENMFEEFDQDGSGKIEKQELKKFLASLLQPKTPKSSLYRRPKSKIAYRKGL